MCGRYSFTLPPDAIRELFEAGNLPDFPSRYNIAPTDAVPVIRRSADGKREAALMRFGLVPYWAKPGPNGKPQFDASTINAKAETVAEKPAFRQPFAKRRCLVLADGFYEWQKLAGGAKQAWRFVPEGNTAFAFAGIWDSWRPPAGEPVLSFAIITTDANDVVRPIHDRMPVILAPDAFDTWLDPRVAAEVAKAFLIPAPARSLRAYRVSSRVNSVKNDDAECIAPQA
ncbi:MAG TPA: SOS response-associated peptidase [Candidatus Cybelea sp.]|nr:SOS response-associated peptidase [Candidatus Cybelea sp.]